MSSINLQPKEIDMGRMMYLACTDGAIPYIMLVDLHSKLDRVIQNFRRWMRHEFSADMIVMVVVSRLQLSPFYVVV